MIGAEPRAQWRRDLVKLNDRGFILTGRGVPRVHGRCPVHPCRSRRACQAIKTLAAQIRVICAPRAGPDKAIACNWVARCAGDEGMPQVADVRASRLDLGFEIYAALPLACRLASDESRLRQ
jgi:hypothetical protein